jgi:glycosyltransferase involved in cell wall biosynthesis
VLSWSLLEAMAAGCLVVSSRTAPVEEVMHDGDNGFLVDFFDFDGLANRVLKALAGKDGTENDRIKAAARQTVLDRYDLNTVCLPAYLALLRRLMGKKNDF